MDQPVGVPAAELQTQAGQFGNAGRNIARGPGYTAVDLALVRDFALDGADAPRSSAPKAFNLANHVNFGLPVADLNSPNFGRILSAGPPRLLAVRGMKLDLLDWPTADTTNDQDQTGATRAGAVAVASGVGVFVSFASLLVYTFGVFLKPLAEEFGWSREAVSAAFGIAAMTVAVCSPPLGYLLDRISPRRIIVPCLTIFGCAFASLSLLTPRLWHFYLVVLCPRASSATARRRWPTHVPSRAGSTRDAAPRWPSSCRAGRLARMVLPPAAAALIDSLGWRERVPRCSGGWCS